MRCHRPWRSLLRFRRSHGVPGRLRRRRRPAYLRGRGASGPARNRLCAASMCKANCVSAMRILPCRHVTAIFWESRSPRSPNVCCIAITVFGLCRALWGSMVRRRKADVGLRFEGFAHGWRFRQGRFVRYREVRARCGVRTFFVHASRRRCLFAGPSSKRGSPPSGDLSRRRPMISPNMHDSGIDTFQDMPDEQEKYRLYPRYRFVYAYAMQNRGYMCRK